MGLFKKGKIWHADFWFLKQRYQITTHCTNLEKAKSYLSSFKHNLALTGVGLVQKATPPLLSTFLQGDFLSAERQNAKTKGTLQLYELNVKRLCEYLPFTQLHLDQITELSIQGYKQTRLNKKLSPSTINGELRTLRKALIFANNCGLCPRIRVSTLPGEKNRIFVVDGELEKAYLAVAQYPLREVAILMLDMGLRPEEAVALRKDDVSHSGCTVTSGKTINARRSLPQTERTREVFELCFALFPESEWVFPGKRGHLTAGTVSNLHTELRNKTRAVALDSMKRIKTSAVDGVHLPIVPAIATPWPDAFVLYAFRHSFGTRLAESGASVFDIRQLMGHSSVKVSERYIHPGAEHLSLAMKRLERYGKIMRGELIHEASPDPVES